MVSLLGNRGVLIKPVNEILSDFDMVYHIGYFILCALGFFCHEFFFSLLVSPSSLRCGFNMWAGATIVFLYFKIVQFEEVLFLYIYIYIYMFM